MSSAPCNVEVPATEIQIAEAIRISDPDTADTIRRLAFERDRLKDRENEMNDVFGEIRRTVATTPFDPEPIEEPDVDGPWLPVGLLRKIDMVMKQEHRR